MNSHTENDDQKNGRTLMTKQLHEIFRFVQSEYAKNGYIPSLGDISIRFGFRSNSTAKYHVDKLVSMGYLSKEEGKRAYYPGPLFINTQDAFACEEYAEETDSLSRFVVSDNDSTVMGILKGDTVMYRKQDEANPKDCCIIQVGNKTLVRRMIIKDAHVWYIGDNNSVPAINGLDVQILGIPVRSYRIW